MDQLYLSSKKKDQVSQEYSRHLLSLYFCQIKPQFFQLNQAMGDSMYPTLYGGDTLEIDYALENLTRKKLDGQIVITQRKQSGRILLHRYILSENQTKGDANAYFDEGEFEILGKVIKVTKPMIYRPLRWKYAFMRLFFKKRTLDNDQPKE